MSNAEIPVPHRHRSGIASEEKPRVPGTIEPALAALHFPVARRRTGGANSGRLIQVNRHAVAAFRISTLLTPTTRQAEVVMTMKEICNRDVAVATRETSAQAAAKLMRHYHVGSLVVIDRKEGRRVPVGVVTDRDLIMEIHALDLDATVIAVGDIMCDKLVTVPETFGVMETVQKMRMEGVRRVPVVDCEGGLVGIVTLDDMVGRLATELKEVADAVIQEQTREVWLRSRGGAGMRRPRGTTV